MDSVSRNCVTQYLSAPPYRNEGQNVRFIALLGLESSIGSNFHEHKSPDLEIRRDIETFCSVKMFANYLVQIWRDQTYNIFHNGENAPM